jgi:glutamyl-tRNA synthetase
MENKMTIRVRWAPSNTGPDVHIGNVRTILFNYLLARKLGATTVFRIEDSDIARSKPEYADAISDTLNWLGLTADEGYRIGGDFGPYTQTAKLDRYKQVSDTLIEKGLAYRCYCTNDELNALRNQLPEKMRHTFRYPGICRDRKEWPKDKDYVVRMVAPTEGSVELNDIVFGKIITPNIENYDWVIMRSNGIPLYNFGCAVDDYDQQITHIIRGRDHIINTPCQIILHSYLGTRDIKFAHLPMMLGPDGAKLSKRHGSVSISEYRKNGYTASGILNYLAKFGWGHKNQEIFSMNDLIEKFSIENCGKNDGKFDANKFSSIQYSHLKSQDLTSDLDYASGMLPFILARGFDVSANDLTNLVALVRPRSKTLLEAANEIEPILQKDINIEKDLSDKFLTSDNKNRLNNFAKFLSLIDTWSEDAIRNSTRDYLKENNLTMTDLGQPLRISIFGRSNSPEIFAIMRTLGKERTINRITKNIG